MVFNNRNLSHITLKDGALVLIQLLVGVKDHVAELTVRASSSPVTLSSHTTRNSPEKLPSAPAGPGASS
jgi:hypothetical protein